MLRHEVVQQTSRTLEQREATATYLQFVGEQLRTATEFPARPNTLCGWCEYRTRCPAHAEMLQGRREHVAEGLDDLEQVAREREEVARLSKALYRRHQQLDKVLLAHLEHQDELELSGVRYRTFNTTTTRYPLERTVALLSRETGKSQDEVRELVATVDNQALTRLLRKLGKHRTRAEVGLIRTELEAFAEHTHTPRVWSKEKRT